MYTVLLLILSNIFMTFAWYGHLRQNSAPLWIAIFASWGIAFFEYCLMIPANRMGYAKYGLSGFQLKIIQEVITLAVFVAFVFILAGVYFAFLPKQAEAASNSAITSEAK